MPASAQTEVNEIQKMINDVPANTAKVIDLQGKTYVIDYVKISESRKITIKNGTLTQTRYDKGTFIFVTSSSLTLENVEVNGDEGIYKISVAPLISLNNSDMFIKAGTEIKGNEISYNEVGAVSGILVKSNSSLVEQSLCKGGSRCNTNKRCNTFVPISSFV